MPELDISASADEVVGLLNQNRARDAASRLDTLRQDQSLVVQESLDRLVATRASERLAALRQPGSVAAADAPAVAPMLERLGGATAAPRFPAAQETANLSQAQQHDVYASIVGTRGTDAARTALEGHDRVILGMRNENRTTENRGRGVYDDRIAVIWRDADGTRHTREYNTVSTEPTAQYDGHAKTSPRSEGFANVVTRVKTEGNDVNGDRVADLGRLAEGTTEMLATEHPRKNHPDEFALRPTPAAVNAGQRRVERDSNADGWFDARDVNGVQDLNNTFKIHRGSGANTDSGGCQTIGGGQYDDFVSTVRGTPGQDRWQYVLTSVAPGDQQQRQRDQPGQAPAQAAAPAASDPRNANHPDHALQTQISGKLRDLGGQYAQNADAYSLRLLYDAKANRLTSVDDITLSNATGTRAQGENLFMVQGRANDPASTRVTVATAALTQAPVEASLDRLQQQAREQAGQTPAPQHEAPSIGGR